MASDEQHQDRWIAARMRSIESSGIRKVFELARSLKDPVNLSIGQPHFDVPDPIKAAAHAAIDRGANAYTVTQGIPELLGKIQDTVRCQYRHTDRQVVVTSGTSGGLVLALCCTVNPGDEVIIFDPYFVMYPHVITLAGGTPVLLDTYPDFRIDADSVRAAITSHTKAIIVNSPANPTGMVYPRACLRDLALLAQERGILLLSDEVYRVFSYDEGFCSPAEFNEDVVVFDGFSKAYGMTGWRLGFAHGPRHVIEEMIKLQQFSFVCAPSMVQHAGVAAWDYDVGGIVAEYRRKRDRAYAGLKDNFELVKPGGAFYLFPKAPGGTGTEFVAEAIRNNLLIIPGHIFSHSDSHFRLSYAADDRTLDRGLEILNRLARG
ncbi:MAG TPA: aminotransferase class I/II-fold pyridoxal phosphate-dependent enzyme [Gemmataceae bacterium]|nr:aminotransferase class I/II-fold pyridoxal phosphate-dependent enzyme [Gemmataceae bacterium]